MKLLINHVIGALWVLGSLPLQADTSTATASPDAYEQFRSFQGFRSLVKGGTVEARWADDGQSFVFSDASTEPAVTYRVEVQSNTKVALDADEVAALAGTPAAPADTALSPDGRYALSTDDNNLVLKWTVDGRSVSVSSDGTENFSWGRVASMPTPATNPEWAPNSLRFVAAKVDTEGVSRSPVVRWLKAREEVEWRVMPRPGEPLSKTFLHIVDVVSQQALPIEGTGLADHSYYPVGWSADGAEYFFMRMDRRMQKLELLAAAATTGASRLVLTETSETFIAGLDFIMRSSRYFTPVGDGPVGDGPVGDGGRFLWISERDGWDQLYLYERDGQLQRRLTQGEFTVMDVLRVDEESGWVYFTAYSDRNRPYDLHLCRVNLNGKGFAQLTQGAGTHHPRSMLFPDAVGIQFSPSGDYFLDTWSAPGTPPRTELRRADGTLLQVVAEANIDALQALNWTPPEEFVAKAADGVTDVYGVMYKPANFDASRSYPVIDHIYNGPFVSWVPHTFTDRIGVTAQAMAQGGFVVLVVDGRGTTGRGKAFQDVVYMNWGRNEIPDHVAAIREAAHSRPFMDLDRVGIFGGSWGGYMTVRGMLTAPGFYKVGVAAALVSDLYDHTLNLEWYMGLPQNNRAGYDYASNLLLADQLQGKLLLIHGTLDLNNAPFSSTMKLVDAFIRADKPFDLMVIPEMGHGPSTPAQRKYYDDLHFRYFTGHLGSDQPGAARATGH